MIVQDEFGGSTEYYTARELKSRFLIDKGMLKRYFPEPTLVPRSTDSTKKEKAWPADVVEKTVKDSTFLADYTMQHSAQEGRQELRQILTDAGTLRNLTQDVGIRRHFILHVGPTNSGKTYQALQTLKHAACGVYLGPLRLLALEVFDTLNRERPVCSLLTGQEREDVPNALITSSTIEMCDYSKHYDVAVVDECQLISDSQRGANWTRAILQIRADEVHLCLAPEALELITSMLRTIGAEFDIHTYGRLAPLEYSGVFPSVSEAQPGDALIAFSRRKVLAIAAELEDCRIQTSVLYGGLPPMARREEVRRFLSGESSVVVATDAIGMGVSLPIRRVIFCEVQKNDGTQLRHLTPSEIRQIAGRAGRYGKFESGEVLTMSEPGLVEHALAHPIPPLTRISIPFPRELIREETDLRAYLEEWESLFPEPDVIRERMDAPLYLLGRLAGEYGSFSTRELFQLVSCPFSVDDRRLVGYWHRCCDALLNSFDLPDPYFGEEDLEACEVQYRAHEIRCRLSETFGLYDGFEEERQQLCVKINRLLAESKNVYILRCRKCGRRLPVTHDGLLCEDCQQEQMLDRLIFSSGNDSNASTIGNIAHFTRWKK